MTKYELTKIIGQALTLAKDAGVSAKDVERLQMYEDYLRLKAEGHKVTAIIYHLGEEWDMSESKVYAYIAKMGEAYTLPAKRE